MVLTFEATGADRIASTASSAARAVDDLSATVGERAGTIVLEAVRPPIRTGTLAATVRVIATDEGFAVAAGGPSAPYVAIVHAKHPFITDAYRDREDAVVDTYADALEDVVDTMKGA